MIATNIAPSALTPVSIWDTVVVRLIEQYGDAVFRSWLKPLALGEGVLKQAAEHFRGITECGHRRDQYRHVILFKPGNDRLLDFGR